MKVKGFTLIELLIVIAVLGILIVAILSALDPLEQMRKARDAGRKSDAAELLSAYERYYTTYSCYPWDTGAPTCTAVSNARVGTAVNPDFVDTAPPMTDYNLVAQGELKAQFVSRKSVTDTTVAKRLYVSEAATGRQVSVCFEPESTSARTASAQGPLKTILNAGSETCTATYPTLNDCYVCVPQ